MGVMIFCIYSRIRCRASIHMACNSCTPFSRGVIILGRQTAGVSLKSTEDIPNIARERLRLKHESFFRSRIIRRRYAKLRCYSSRARFPEYTHAYKIGFTKACVKAARLPFGIHGAPLNFHQAADVFFDQFDIGFTIATV